MVPYLVSTYGAVSAMLRSEKSASDTAETATCEESVEAKVDVLIQDIVVQNMERWHPPIIYKSSQGCWIKTAYV